MAMSADAVVTAASRPPLRVGWLVAAAMAVAGVLALVAVGPPTDPILTPIAIFAVAATELMTLDELERRYCSKVLERYGGNKSHAARVLGIDRRSLYRRLNKLVQNS